MDSDRRGLESRYLAYRRTSPPAELAHIRTLPSRLTPEAVSSRSEARPAISAIEHEVSSRGERVRSHAIYEAVLTQGRTLADFTPWHYRTIPANSAETP
ncbi:hypothetical protein GCM10018965_080130 [Nonomuraea roseola]